MTVFTQISITKKYCRHWLNAITVGSTEWWLMNIILRSKVLTVPSTNNWSGLCQLKAPNVYDCHSSVMVGGFI